MASELTGAKNQPYFLATGAPAIDVDPGLVSDYAAKVGNHKVGLATDRAALTGKDVWDGLSFTETDTGKTYQYLASWSGWNLIGTRSGSVTITLATGWAAPSINSFTVQAGWATWSFNGACTSAKAAFAAIATIPSQYAAPATQWITAWGAGGAAPQIQVWFDANTNVVKLGNQPLTVNQSLAFVMSWPLK